MGPAVSRYSMMASRLIWLGRLLMCILAYLEIGMFGIILIANETDLGTRRR